MESEAAYKCLCGWEGDSQPDAKCPECRTWLENPAGKKYWAVERLRGMKDIVKVLAASKEEAEKLAYDIEGDGEETECDTVVFDAELDEVQP